MVKEMVGVLAMEGEVVGAAKMEPMVLGRRLC